MTTPAGGFSEDDVILYNKKAADEPSERRRWVEWANSYIKFQSSDRGKAIAWANRQLAKERARRRRLNTGRREKVWPADSLTDADRVRLAVPSRSGKTMLGPLESEDCGHGKRRVYRWTWGAGSSPEDDGEPEIVKDPECKICVPEDDAFGNPADDFDQWISGTAVSRGGQPLVVYHSTNADFSGFRPYTHFGTAEAANDRADMLRAFSEDVVGRDPGAFRVLPVYLSIKNPLRMADLAALDSMSGLPLEDAWSRFFRREDLDQEAWDDLTEDERDSYQEVPRPRGWESEEAVGETLLEMGVIDIDEFEEKGRDNDGAFELLADKGYDGIVYENVVEAPGSESWINFRSDQVRPMRLGGVRRNARPPKGQPTSLNLYVLARLFQKSDEVLNRLEPTDVPHLRRCLAAGLVEVVSKQTLRITPAGRAAVANVPPPPPPLPPPPPFVYDPKPLPTKIYFRVRLGSRFLGSPIPATIEDNHNLAATFDDRDQAERAAEAASRYHGQEARVETFFLGR